MSDTSRRLVLVPAAVLAAALVTGCWGGPERACTGVGSLRGIGLDVEPPLAERVAKATMRVCWDGECVAPELTLRPSTTAAPASCSGTDPDEACVASAVPTGAKHGFADVPKLPERRVEVRVVLRDDAGKELLDERLRVTPERTYPNGPDCGAGDPQAQLVVDDDTLRVRR